MVEPTEAGQILRRGLAGWAAVVGVDVRLDVVEVVTEPADMEPVRTALEEAGFTISDAERAWMPQNTVPLDEKAAIAALKLLERLDELDDVQRVFSNADFPAEVIEAASA